jgi:hypothetical protein
MSWKRARGVFKLSLFSLLAFLLLAVSVRAAELNLISQDAFAATADSSTYLATSQEPGIILPRLLLKTLFVFDDIFQKNSRVDSGEFFLQQTPIQFCRVLNFISSGAALFHRLSIDS